MEGAALDEAAAMAEAEVSAATAAVRTGDTARGARCDEVLRRVAGPSPGKASLSLRRRNEGLRGDPLGVETGDGGASARPVEAACGAREGGEVCGRSSMDDEVMVNLAKEEGFGPAA